MSSLTPLVDQMQMNIYVAKPSIWCCKVAGLTWRPGEGNHPNWFHRLMHRIFFGARWIKDPDVILKDGITLGADGSYTVKKDGITKAEGSLVVRPFNNVGSDERLKLLSESSIQWSSEPAEKDLSLYRDSSSEGGKS